ncbi:MAG: hypothetical protein RL234_1531 [Pseudomonadota bacterium]
MAACDSQMVKVACRRIGASPTPAEIKHPGVPCKSISAGGALDQKEIALRGLIDARVSDAIGPDGGVLSDSVNW